MKYIRTKDGIFENNTRFNDKALNELSNGLIDIIKQADTIEELCDEFVCGENREIFDWFGEELKRDYKLIYGAIWTDKGLQFVARMNNEGVLELI